MILNYDTSESVWDTFERPSNWVEFVIASIRGPIMPLLIKFIEF